MGKIDKNIHGGLKTPINLNGAIVKSKTDFLDKACLFIHKKGAKRILRICISEKITEIKFEPGVRNLIRITAGGEIYESFSEFSKKFCLVKSNSTTPDEKVFIVNKLYKAFEDTKEMQIIHLLYTGFRHQFKCIRTGKIYYPEIRKIRVPSCEVAIIDGLLPLYSSTKASRWIK